MAVATVGLIAGLAGCPSGSASPAPDERTKALPDSREAQVATDIDTLAKALPIIAARMHWGLKKVDNQVTALRAEALTPDDRTVEIRAQTTAAGSAVQVKVGFFGHEAEEKQFLATLAQVLAKAKEN
jgi:hypothetical protein